MNEAKAFLVSSVARSTIFTAAQQVNAEQQEQLHALPQSSRILDRSRIDRGQPRAVLEPFETVERSVSAGFMNRRQEE
jgi:hypothetical protein